VLSSDCILFKVCSKDLATLSGAFPTPELTIPRADETIQLPESASVLKLLFQFMRHQRQPNMSAVPFSVMAPFAEAVEKYDVFPATEVCRVYMTAAIPDHSVEVLAYALKHDIQDVVDVAAPMTIGKSLDVIQAAIPIEFVLPWVKYRESWLKIFLGIIRDASDKDAHFPYHYDPNKLCSQHVAFKQAILKKLGGNLGRILEIESIFNQQMSGSILSSGCSECLRGSKNWLGGIVHKTALVPRFSTFLAH